ncbi:MAG: molybdopterin-dependent oxidoreductase [Candidatus Binatia bacterium]|nr:molybdopterin-dependent oxidoreductase [Candidatus Binatia bacterium]
MTRLRIEGEGITTSEFGFAELAQLPGQITDVSQLVPGREGGGVRLHSLLEAVGRTSAGTYLTLESADGTFAASVPLEAVREAIIVYRLADGPLPPHKGGPFRFLIPQVEHCTTGEVDACANVKHLGCIRLSQEPGRDTRPTSAAAHALLHTHTGHSS